MKFILFLSFCALVFTTVNSQTVYSSVEQFKKSPELKNASIGIMAIDLKTGDTIISNNIFSSLPCASTTKLFSTASALELLGKDYRPETRIYSDQKIDSSGILNGNLWVRGGGDPTLGSKYFNSPENKTLFFEKIATHLKQKGIQKINGNLTIDASEFGYEGAPDDWTWSDMGNYYGAGFSGINLLDNILELHFKTSNKIGGKTTIISTVPNIENLNIQNYVIAAKSSRDNAYIYGSPYSKERFVTGSIPYNRADFTVKGSIPDTEQAFGELLKKMIESQGIKITGEIQTGRQLELQSSDETYKNFHLIHSIKGNSILEIVNKTNEKSINLFAESLVHLIGKEKHSSNVGTNSNGISIMDYYWKSRINTHGLYLKDGSGLSRSNGISPSHFVELLKWMSNHKNGEIFKNSLPIAGETGTLRSVCKKQAAHGKLRAKSGTMRRIKSYAGYIDSSSGKKIAFAIIVNNHSCSSRHIVRKMEPIFNALAKY